VRLLTLKEHCTSLPVELSVTQRDALRTSVPDLTIEPAPGLVDSYLLTPGSRVGAVMIDDIAIQIVPKLPIERVMFLLSYSLGLAKWGDRQFELDPDEALIEALIPVFQWHLDRALRRGVLQGYRTEKDAIPSVRGRIRMDDQLRRRFGMPMPVEVQFDEFTEDIEENRLLKAALSVLMRLRIRSEMNRKILRRFDRILELVSLQSYPPSRLPAVTFTRLNEHYRGAVEWARLILRFASMESRHGQLTSTTLLFDMNAVFEDFVRVALREELDVASVEFPSGGECPSLYLDAARQVALQPDLSYWMGQNCYLVGDVKYKAVNVAGVKHPDIYQLLAYTTATGLPNGLLVYAAGEGVATAHRVKMSDKILHVSVLELAGDIQSLRTEVRVLANRVRSLVAENRRTTLGAALG
jgi:5-methylcytosine-specific restriction enzyme subunit McrC